MLIQHSPEILVHRLSRLGTNSLGVSQALVAKIRADMMTRQTLERLDAPSETPAAPKSALDKTA